MNSTIFLFAGFANIGNISSNIFVMDRLAVFAAFVVPTFSICCGDGTIAKLWVHAGEFSGTVSTPTLKSSPANSNFKTKILRPTPNNLNPTI